MYSSALLFLKASSLVFGKVLTLNLNKTQMNDLLNKLKI